VFVQECFHAIQYMFNQQILVQKCDVLKTPPKHLAKDLIFSIQTLKNSDENREQSYCAGKVASDSDVSSVFQVKVKVMFI